MAVNRETSFTVEGAPDDLLAAMVQALSELRCYRFTRDGMTVTARTPFNWRSIGEIMTVRLSEADAGTTRLDVASHSILGTVIFDWGKNNDNLRRFESAFRKRIAEQAGSR
jgi:hypothetical protein